MNFSSPGLSAPAGIGVAMRAAGVVPAVSWASLLREADRPLERGDARLEGARALADLGAMLRRRNRRTEARELLREALDSPTAQAPDHSPNMPRPSSAPPARARAGSFSRARLADSQRTPRLPSSPARDSRTARSPRCCSSRRARVEGHLTSVFRKLQVDSRDDLPAALAHGAPVPA